MGGIFMELVVFIGPLLLLILGIVLRSGKASFLISGYNTLPKKEKEKYDEKKLCKFVSNLMFLLSLLLSFNGIITILKPDNYALFYIIGLFFFIVVAIVAVIYMNTGNRFKKE